MNDFSWACRVPLDVGVVEGPQSEQAMTKARAIIVAQAERVGLDPDRIEWQFKAPRSFQGSLVGEVDPITGETLAPTYTLTGVVPA